MRLVARLAVVLLLAVVGLVTAPSPAHAGESRYWDNDDGSGLGYARGGLEVTFLSKRAVDVQGFIEDVCPKDGRSGYMMFTVMLDGGSGLRGLSPVADSNGCGNGRRYFDPAPFKTPFKGNIIAGVSAYVCMKDFDSQPPAISRCSTVYFDNWRVS